MVHSPTYKRHQIIRSLTRLIVAFVFLFPPVSYAQANQTPASSSPALKIDISALVPPMAEQPSYDVAILEPLRAVQKVEADQQVAADALAAQKALIASQQAAAQAAAEVAPTYTSYGSNYTAGQCTAFVASQISVPSGMGNASNWAYGLTSAGWSQGLQVGAIATLNGGNHVAIVAAIGDGQVEIHEMNGPNGPFTTDYRWVPTSSYSYFYH